MGLIDIANKKKRTFKKAIPSAKSFNPWVVLSVIQDQAQGRREIGLNELLMCQCNIGKVFNLDAITMLDILHDIENMGMIKIIRTAGLDVINLNQQLTFIECVKRYYQSITEGE